MARGSVDKSSHTILSFGFVKSCPSFIGGISVLGKSMAPIFGLAIGSAVIANTSRNIGTCGAPSWSERWKNYNDVDMNNWPRIRDGGRLGELDGLLQGRLRILLNSNLVSNIGFGADATHTSESGEMSNLWADSVQFPLRYPQGVFQCRMLDSRFFKKFLAVPLYRRIRNRLRYLVSA